MKSVCTTLAIEGMSTAPSTRVSKASRGGSFHFAAMAAYLHTAKEKREGGERSE